MLVQLATRNAKASSLMANSTSMERGFAVNANTVNNNLSRKIQKAMNLKLSVGEDDVLKQAELAGNTEVTKNLFGQYLNYKQQQLSNYAQMQIGLHNFYRSAAATSAQVAQSQDSMVQGMAQSAFNIAQSAAKTRGMYDAYSRSSAAAQAIM